MGLSNKRKAFINEYLLDFNATQAAIRAGYSERSASVTASRLLANANISEAVKVAIEEKAMRAEEVLLRLADMARSDMGDFMEIDSMSFSLDLAKAKQLGITKLIKKVKQKTTTFLSKNESDEDREVNEIEIELYDAQAALVHIGRYHAMFTDKSEVDVTGPVTVKVLKNVSTDDL